MAALPVQVILSVYENVTQLLTGFDDSCCYVYVPGKGVFATPRGLRALRNGVNIFDSNFEGNTYCHRLEKWDDRGYAIGVPGLIAEKISRRFLDASYFSVLSGREAIILRGEKQNISSLQLVVGGGASKVNEGVTERCRVLHGFERLAAKKLGRVSRVDGAKQCSPIVLNSSAMIVWGRPSKAPEPNDSDVEYSAAPVESVQSLLEEVSARNANVEEREFQWWLGGAFRQGSSKPVFRALSHVDTDVYHRIDTRQSLHFVYDLVTHTTPFAELKFTLDAGRSPMCDLPNELFQEIYGLSKELRFKSAERREVEPTDLWSILY